MNIIEIENPHYIKGFYEQKESILHYETSRNTFITSKRVTITWSLIQVNVTWFLTWVEPWKHVNVTSWYGYTFLDSKHGPRFWNMLASFIRLLVNWFSALVKLQNLVAFLNFSPLNHTLLNSYLFFTNTHPWCELCVHK